MLVKTPLSPIGLQDNPIFGAEVASGVLQANLVFVSEVIGPAPITD